MQYNRHFDMQSGAPIGFIEGGIFFIGLYIDDNTFNKLKTRWNGETVVGRLNVDSMDGLKPSGGECFKSDLFYHSNVAGYVRESGTPFEQEI